MRQVLRLPIERLFRQELQNAHNEDVMANRS
jgi:hypothetical protein